jgi:hypothetical protein
MKGPDCEIQPNEGAAAAEHVIALGNAVESFGLFQTSFPSHRIGFQSEKEFTNVVSTAG